MVINAANEHLLKIGIKGENIVTGVDFSAFINRFRAEHGDVSASLAVMREGDSAPYMKPVTDEGIWIIGAEDIVSGNGMVDLICISGDAVKKWRWKTAAVESLGDTKDPPDVWKSYVDSIAELVEGVENLTVSATESLVPSVEKTKDEKGRVHLTFGLVSGKDGLSPVVTLKPAADGVQISVKDATGESSQIVKHGLPGKDGVNPTLKLERTETGVLITATDKDGTTSQVVKDGKAGYSPSAVIRQTESGAVVTITDVSGTTTATITNGKDGQDGKDGSDADVTEENIKAALGYTPANDAESVKNTSFETLKTTVAGKLDKPVNEPWTGAVPIYDDGAIKWHTSVYSVNGQTGNVELPTVDPSIERRLTNLEYAANGVLYREDVTESEDYEKPLAPDVMPYGTLDKIAGKTIVMNQLVGDTYPEPFEGEVYEQTIPEKVKSVSVKSWGGKSVVWNKLSPAPNGAEMNTTNIGGAITFDGDTVKLVPNTQTFAEFRSVTNKIERIINHRYYISYSVYADAWTSTSTWQILPTFAGLWLVEQTGDIDKSITGVWQTKRTLFNMTGSGTGYIAIRAYQTDDTPVYMRNWILVDLTAMGWDDITSTDDPRIAWIEQYAEAHHEYNAGEIISADVECVTSKGVNLIDDTQEVYPKTANGVTFVRNSDGSITANGTSTGYPFIRVGTVKLIKGKLYTLSGLYTRIMRLDNGASKVLVPTPQTFVAQDNYDAFVEIALDINTTYSNAQYMCIVTAGSSVTAYTPYRTPIVRTIPEAVRALDGYGWSAGTAMNYIERTEDGKWLYHKQVGAVELSALTWSYVSANKYWVGQCDGVKLRRGIIAEKYRYTPGSLNINTEPYRITDWYANGNRFDVKTEGIDNNDTKPTGIAYYTLSNPVVTDITALIGTALNGIEVEPGGTLTFVQSGSTNLTVPVTETLNLGEWQQPLDTTHRYSVNGSLLTGAANTEVTGGTDYIIDLTRAGVDTPAAFPEPYYALNPGELVSKAHEAVVSRGRNLLDIDSYNTSQTWNVRRIPNMLKNGTTYTYTGKSNAYGFRIYGSYDGTTTDAALCNGYIPFTFAKLTFTTPTDVEKYPYIILTGSNTAAPSVIKEMNLMLVEGSTELPYAPYTEETTPLAAIIRKYYPDGMHSLPNGGDVFDIENGIAIQYCKESRIGAHQIKKVDYNGSHYRWQFTVPGLYKPVNYDDSFNIKSDKFTPNSAPTAYISGVEKAISGYTNDTNLYTYVADLDNNTSTVETYMRMYGDSKFVYRLAEPISTPIDPADLETLRTLHVEAGGSLTFTDTNAGFRIPCGNKESFLVKTGGVSA